MDVVFCSYFAVVAFLTVLSVESTVYMTRETNSIVELRMHSNISSASVSVSVVVSLHMTWSYVRIAMIV